MSNKTNIEKDIKILQKLKDVNKYNSIGKAIETVLTALENSIPKEKVRETIKKIKEYEDIAREQIQERIVVADSDSLNFGRKQAHGKDIEELKILLKE